MLYLNKLCKFYLFMSEFTPKTPSSQPNKYSLYKRASGVLAGGIILASCSATEPTFSPEAKEMDVVTICYSELPDCTPEDVARGDGLEVIRKGNSISLETIPSMCTGENAVGPDTDSSVPRYLLQALLAVEDNNFCTHNGVDWTAIGSAAIDTATGMPRGGSTLTMQLVRIWYGPSLSENVLTRKSQEIELAQEIESAYSKTEIAKAYLDGAYMGRGVYGFGAAAKAYFGIDAEDLSLGQSAALVALLQNPGKYQGSPEPLEEEDARALHESERNEVLNSMLSLGIITNEEAEFAKNEPLRRVHSTYNSPGADMTYANAAVRKIIDDTVEQLGSRDALFNIQSINTTISKREQQALYDSYKPRTLEQPNDGRQFGAVIVDQTGAITAYIPGIYSERTGAKNINLLESPVVGGSQDKPYFVLSAMLAGATPDTIVGDPATFQWLNYDGQGRDYSPSENAARCPGVDQCSLRDSIAYSANWGIVGLIKSYEEQGIPALSTGYEIMNSYGLDCYQPVGPAGIVGGCELTPVQRALGSMQINGLEGRAIPEELRGRMVNSIRLDNGKVIRYDNPNAAYQRIVPQEIALQTQSILQSAVEYGTAKRLGGAAQNTVVFAKTGTPTNNTAPGVNLTWLAYDGSFRSMAVVLRQPETLSPLGNDADGGKAPTILANDVVNSLS